jgi:hypothetical protein
MFRLPFRQELYRKHLESVHAQDWIAYKALCPEQKTVFDGKQRSVIHPYLESTKEFITSDIPNVAIVDELIGNLFFKPELDEDDEETEPVSKANALNRFVRRYAVTITNLCGSGSRSIKVGLSFR